MKKLSITETSPCLFVVNPNSGKKQSVQVMNLLQKELNSLACKHEILVWKEENAFDDIHSAIQSGKYQKIIAVGGDGTINRIASCLLNSDKILGIIPSGSGNGLARSLGFSMNPRKALQQNLQSESVNIDAGQVNEKFFFCTAGIGFDAYVSHLFSLSKERGLKTYARLVIQNLFRYKGVDVQIRMNDAKIDSVFFMITVANAPQFGNNFYIAPTAKLNDGKFQVTAIPLLKPFRLLSLLVSAAQKKIHHQTDVLQLSHHEFEIQGSDPFPYHLDGEPMGQETLLKIKLRPNALNVIAPAKTFLSE
jgi:YegS/Rv2252/BmrU family lipid kinase